jgi:hypothetical protein
MKNKIFFLIVFSIIFLLIGSKANAEKNSAGSSAQLQASASAKIDDVRVKILKAYLEQYSSPLSEFALDFIDASIKYDFDWKLVAAISGVESTFGKQIPYNSYNGWGWGVYGNNVIYFSSWQEGIETVSKGLRENFIDKIGTDDVYAIGRTYAASPTWASRVEYFMEKIAKFQYENQVNNLSISL